MNCVLKILRKEKSRGKTSRGESRVKNHVKINRDFKKES